MHTDFLGREPLDNVAPLGADLPLTPDPLADLCGRCGGDRNRPTPADAIYCHAAFPETDDDSEAA